MTNTARASTSTRAGTGDMTSTSSSDYRKKRSIHDLSLKEADEERVRVADSSHRPYTKDARHAAEYAMYDDEVEEEKEEEEETEEAAAVLNKKLKLRKPHAPHDHLHLHHSAKTDGLSSTCHDPPTITVATNTGGTGGSIARAATTAGATAVSGGATAVSAVSGGATAVSAASGGATSVTDYKDQLASLQQKVQSIHKVLKQAQDHIILFKQDFIHDSDLSVENKNKIFEKLMKVEDMINKAHTLSHSVDTDSV